METVAARKENKTLDLFKFLVCLLIVAVHLPSLLPAEAEAYYNEWFIRFCVPFFFVCSGYFYSKTRNKVKSLKRVAWLFLLAYLLYLPMLLEGAGDVGSVVSRLRWNLLFGYEHLWYLNAMLQGMVIWYVLEKIPVISGLFEKIGAPAAVVLMMIGALLDEHYRWMDNGLLQTIGNALAVFGGPRNVIFMGFPLLVLGGAMAKYEARIRRIPAWVLLAAWVVLRALAYWECDFLFGRLGFTTSNDLTFFGCWPALILFELSFRIRLPLPEALAKLLRKLSEYIYVLHPMIAVFLSRYLSLNPLQLLISTVAMCSGIYILLEKQFIVKKG